MRSPRAYFLFQDEGPLVVVDKSLEDGSLHTRALVLENRQLDKEQRLQLM